MTQEHEAYETLHRTCVVLLFVAISAVFLFMIRGLLMPVFVAAIGAGLANPLYQTFCRLFRGRKGAAVTATIAVIVLVVVTPLVLITGMVASQAAAISTSLQPWVDQHVSQDSGPFDLLEGLPFAEKLQPYQTQLTAKVAEISSALSSFLVSALSAATRGTMSFFFHLFIMLFSMVFFLTKGPETLGQVMRLFPLDEGDKEILLDKFVSVSRATLKGTLVIGIVQGGLAGIAFAVAGINGAAFWGTVMAVLSIVPGIGTALIWVPAVIYLFAIGKVIPAIGLLLWCAIVVGLADNFLRPVLVGSDTEMPDLMIMLSTFGGLGLFGAIGIVVGPVIAALFLAIWRIYCDTFSELLAPPEATTS